MSTKLDHCNIRTTNVDATIRFYTEVMGLHRGTTPGSPPFWLYDANERPIVHLIPIDPAKTEDAFKRIKERLGELTGPLDSSALTGSGAIDHIAFECDDYEAMVATFKDRGLPYRESAVPSMRLRQLFVNDPSGITLELNFRG